MAQNEQDGGAENTTCAASHDSHSTKKAVDSSLLSVLCFDRLLRATDQHEHF